MNLRNIVEEAWENRELLKKQEVREVIFEVVDQLDRGVLRVAQKIEKSMAGKRLGKKSCNPLFPHQTNGDHRASPL